MKCAKSVCWVFYGLMLAANGGYAQEAGEDARKRAVAEIEKPAEDDAREKPLRDAEALMKAGKPADAYNLLAPLEFDRAGEVRFDYLLGIAALDSGKPDKATLAFERVLAVDPDDAGARLDMARAYYQLGDLPRAKTEFETVLKQNPSETARATIRKYLDSIAGHEAAKQTRVSGYVEGTAGRDTNVNNASDTAGNIVVTTPNPANVEISDYYFGVAAGGEVHHSLNANWGLYAAADLRQRSNNTQKSFDTLSLDERAGVTYGTDANRLRVGMSGEQHTLGSSRDRNTTGLNVEWRHAVDHNNQVNLFGQYVQYRYADAAMKLNDINQQAAGVGWLHMLEDTKSTLSGSLYYGMENDVGPVTMANPGGGRSDGAMRFIGFRVGGQAVSSESMKLFVNAGGQAGNYSKVDPIILSQRTDRQYDLTLGANWSLDKQWTVRPQLTHFRNHSNVANYTYDRTDVSLTIRRNFK